MHNQVIVNDIPPLLKCWGAMHIEEEVIITYRNGFRSVMVIYYQ